MITMQFTYYFLSYYQQLVENHKFYQPVFNACIKNDHILAKMSGTCKRK